MDCQLYTNIIRGGGVERVDKVPELFSNLSNYRVRDLKSGKLIDFFFVGGGGGLIGTLSSCEMVGVTPAAGAINSHAES